MLVRPHVKEKEGKPYLQPQVQTAGIFTREDNAAAPGTLELSAPSFSAANSFLGVLVPWW